MISEGFSALNLSQVASENFRAIIHMNGRVYSPSLGRMLSPDPVTQAPENGQNYNRYSYAFNNPLKFTDPSGYCNSAGSRICWAVMSRCAESCTFGGSFYLRDGRGSLHEYDRQELKEYMYSSLPAIEIGDKIEWDGIVTPIESPGEIGSFDLISDTPSLAAPNIESALTDLVSAYQGAIPAWTGTTTSHEIGQSLSSGPGTYGVDLLPGNPSSVATSLETSVLVALAAPIAIALAPGPAIVSAGSGIVEDLALDTPITFQSIVIDATIGSIVSPIGYASHAGNSKWAIGSDFIRQSAAGKGVEAMLH